ncbi:peroxiredoxin [Actinocrispum wychmicini]|uniref:thioredoxin-dependent peroxiredoxin n=1 Tax=Actinocrispum wychmicini TaxID=1213861 RepID=A0A4R2IWS5_9PSEU|nr:peroxiredoxin [Actinocrispum wychmicini]TCO48866.1 peroxiredoxin Q/BCP [Actinocrispum wychmicini]
MEIGDTAPDFELPDETGTLRKLSDFLADGPVVLFFYPAAMTKGCTAESCHFRDLAKEFTDAGAVRVGISPDKVDKQQEFSSTYSLGFPLLSDADGEVAKQFDVRRKFGPLLTKRKTFVIGTDRKVIETIKSELRMDVHADKALEAVRNHKAADAG